MGNAFVFASVSFVITFIVAMIVAVIIHIIGAVVQKKKPTDQGSKPAAAAQNAKGGAGA